MVLHRGPRPSHCWPVVATCNAFSAPNATIGVKKHNQIVSDLCCIFTPKCDFRVQVLAMNMLIMLKIVHVKLPDFFITL